MAKELCLFQGPSVTGVEGFHCAGAVTTGNGFFVHEIQIADDVLERIGLAWGIKDEADFRDMAIGSRHRIAGLGLSNSGSSRPR